MAHEPKLEVFKITLNPKANTENTFASFLETNYQIEGEPFDINESYTRFYKDLLSTFTDSYYLNDKRKKGLGLETKADGQLNDSITLKSELKIISGVLKGGRYGQNRSIGNIASPKDAHDAIEENDIVFDDFYFLLYTPFGSHKGILIIQSYTDDTINDIFQVWLSRMMSNVSFFQPAFSTYCPTRIQEEFKANSVIKEMTFSQDIVLQNVEERETINTDRFTIEINIKAKDDVRLNMLDDLKRIFKNFGLKRPANNSPIRLEDFNRKVGRLLNGTRQSSFELDGNLDIKPTIFLKEHIQLQADGSPNFRSLDEFSNFILNEVIVEVYPELQVINQANRNEIPQN